MVLAGAERRTRVDRTADQGDFDGGDEIVDADPAVEPAVAHAAGYLLDGKHPAQHAPRSGVDRVGCDGVDGEGGDTVVGQPRIGRAPGRARIDALEDAAVVGPRVQ